MDSPSDPNYQSESRPLWDASWCSVGITPEKRLWYAVLIALVQDIQSAYDVWRDSTNGHTKEFRGKLLKLIDEAMDVQVELICGWVGIDHRYFIERCQRISEGTDRAELINRNFY